MRVFTTKGFRHLCRRENVPDLELRKASRDLAAGKIDADLGAHLFKQRISSGDGGRKGGHRAIIAFQQGERLVFLHLFAKNMKAGLNPDELVFSGKPRAVS